MKSILFIIWMLISVLFVCSIFGLLMFIPKDSYVNGPSNPSTWNQIGKDLLNAIINDNDTGK